MIVFRLVSSVWLVKLCWSQGCCLMDIQSPGKVIKLSCRSHGHEFSLGFSSRNHFAFLRQFSVSLFSAPWLFLFFLSGCVAYFSSPYWQVFQQFSSVLVRSTRLSFWKNLLVAWNTVICPNCPLSMMYKVGNWPAICSLKSVCLLPPGVP